MNLCQINTHFLESSARFRGSTEKYAETSPLAFHSKKGRLHTFWAHPNALNCRAHPPLSSTALNVLNHDEL